MLDTLDISTIESNLDKMTPAELAEVLESLEELERRKTSKNCYDDLIAFCVYMDPNYKVGKHHRRLADLLMAMERGDEDRIGVSIPPRHGKSQLVSIFFPAWYLGRNPSKQVLMVSHTADLAVDFGRKVRNLVGSDAYKEVFPNVVLAADSKSAGRWNTNIGGSYYACLRRYALVHTAEGLVPAGQIKVGDVLLNAGKPVTVREIYNSTHNATYRIQNLDCSANHPIWTMNRGWVYAANLQPTDLLCVESISDILKALLRRVYGYLEHTDVPSVVQHQVSLHKPERRQVGQLRWAWDNIVRSLAGVREFFTGYGSPTYATPHSGADRQRWAIQPRELPVGNISTAAKQQTYQCTDRRKDHISTCTGSWDSARNYTIQTCEGVRPFSPSEKTQEELRAYGDPEGLGWLRRKAAQFIARSGKRGTPKQPKNRVKEYFEGLRGAASRLFGLCVGVRRVGQVTITTHETPQHFVNFLTDGDHTFFVDGVLTHNCGVGAALAGRGADFLIVDDPFSEQDILNGNYEVFQKAYEWFAYGARTRLMPGGRCAIVHTRWHPADLIGQIARDMARVEGMDQYHFFEFPAIFNENTEDERALWPEFYNLEALKRTKASMPLFQWNAQYQQNPTAEEGAIAKREWWRKWEKDEAPSCEYIIMTLDAAAEKNNRADFTALLTWGVFSDEVLTEGNPHVILLNAINVRVEFPELKELALREYREWRPDAFIVEKKSNGTPLYQEMRRMGVVIQEFTPHRGTGDKVARLNAVADIIRSGMVWYPAGRKWAEEVIEQVAAFPASANDDMVDCTSMALARFRNGGFIRLDSDEQDEQTYRRKAAYY